MNISNCRKLRIVGLLILVFICADVKAQKEKPFKVIAFFTAKEDSGHISFVHEANKWFPKIAAENNFIYDSTDNWNNLNDAFLLNYKLVIFLDSRPEKSLQRLFFERYIKRGGAWMGFHFSAFALTPSVYNEDWDWYHNEFLGSGQYVSNTWHPTSAVLKVEDSTFPALKHLPHTFKSQPNEWYRWEYDLRKNADIKILVSIDSSSFPLGNGPKINEIWHHGYYPVVWTNTKYKMIYMNMGHNDVDYDHKTYEQLSSTFGNPNQDRLIIQSILWLAGKKID